MTSLVGLAVLTGAAYLWYQFSLNRNAKAMYDYAEQWRDERRHCRRGRTI